MPHQDSLAWADDVARAVADTSRVIGEPVVVAFGDVEVSTRRYCGSLDTPWVDVRQAGVLVGAGRPECP